MALHLYRRHTDSCAAKRPQNDRTYRRCKCPIQAEGVLRLDGFIRKSTKETSWERAEEARRRWEELGTTEALSDNGLEIRGSEPVAIDYAVGAFLRDASARHWQKPTVRKFSTLLDDRLRRYAEEYGLRYMLELTLDAITEFRATWKDAPLTAQKNIERLRMFFRFCVDRGWCPANPAAKLKVKVTHRQKDPFEPDEWHRILEATRLYSDGRGRVNQANARELRAMVLLLRYAGLRISDGVKLERTQLIKNRNGYAVMLPQQKNQKAVYVPVPDASTGPDDVAGALLDLPPKSTQYFFWTGNGGLDTAVNNWRGRLDKLFKLAETETPPRAPFRTKPHPHRFRHTFAAEYLKAGVPIEIVSALLGHSSVKITEKHYAKWSRARQQQMEDHARRAWARMR